MKVEISILLFCLYSFFCFGQEQRRFGQYSHVQAFAFVDRINSANKINDDVGENVEFYWNLKNSTDSNMTEIMRIRLLELEIDEPSINIFLEKFEQERINHQGLTGFRDSIYAEGLNCLTRLINNEVDDYNDSMMILTPLILNELDSDQIQIIRTYQDIYDQKLAKRAKWWGEEEAMQNGKIGENITNYNQRSFELLQMVRSNSYASKFYIKKENPSFEWVDESPEITLLYQRYIKIEADFLSKLETDDCKKRSGMFRYNAGREGGWRKQNMLINMELKN